MKICELFKTPSSPFFVFCRLFFGLSFVGLALTCCVTQCGLDLVFGMTETIIMDAAAAVAFVTSVEDSLISPPEPMEVARNPHLDP